MHAEGGRLTCATVNGSSHFHTSSFDGQQCDFMPDLVSIVDEYEYDDTLSMRWHIGHICHICHIYHICHI